MPYPPFSPLAGEMSPEATEGGGATNPTLECGEPPPSVSSADIFPARGKKGVWRAVSPAYLAALSAGYGVLNSNTNPATRKTSSVAMPSLADPLK